MASLITQDYFNQQMVTLGLRADFVVDSDALAVMIVEASDWVEGYCDRKFELQSYTEIVHYPFRSKTPVALLENWPVASVTAIAWSNGVGGSGTYDPSLLWVSADGSLLWKNHQYHSWYGDIRYTVTYTAGYATVPSNVQRAVALKVANLMQPQYQGVQDREVFMVTNLEAMIIDLLEQYRRERVG